jgi:lipoprotein NlpI
MLVLLTILLAGAPPNLRPPLTDAEMKTVQEKLQRQLREAQSRVAQAPTDAGALIERGTALFFLGRFPESVADFDKSIELEPSLAEGHWQRGIALFYAGKFAESAKQFERYHGHDDVDRENGIWRYLGQSAAFGSAKARREMLRYEREDRPPLPDVYQMFGARVSKEEIFQRIQERTRSAQGDRARQLFYANLYVGLFLVSERQPQAAWEYLRAATASPWGRQATGGPGFMWHVARIQEEQVRRQLARGG